MPLTHLCVPHASVVTFPALSLCNGTVIRHPERQNAVLLTFLKKTTSLHENRNSAKSTNASDFSRSTRTSRPLARNEQIFKNAVMRFFLQLHQQKCSYTFFFMPPRPPPHYRKNMCATQKATTTRQKISLY